MELAEVTGYFILPWLKATGSGDEDVFLGLCGNSELATRSSWLNWNNLPSVAVGKCNYGRSNTVGWPRRGLPLPWKCYCSACRLHCLLFNPNREVPASEPCGGPGLVSVYGDLQPRAHAQPGLGPVGALTHRQPGECLWALSVMGWVWSISPPPQGLLWVYWV